MIKKSFTLFAVSCILSASAHVFAADSSINVVVDGQPLAFTDAMPQLKDDRTYVPYRAVFEALDATVNFDSATNYETGWVDTGAPDNALYLTQVPSSELPSSFQVASAEQFSSHISYSNGKLSFTVPEGTQTWKIFISGRVELEDFGGMSVHYLEDTTWENGKSYSFDVSQGKYTDLQLNAYCEGQELSMDLLPFLPDALKNSTSTP